MLKKHHDIEPAEDPYQRRRLDRAAAEIRFLARQLDVKIFFFGSYAEERVHSLSDLNIAVPDGLPVLQRKALEEALQKISSEHRVKVSTASRVIAENLGEYLIR